MNKWIHWYRAILIGLVIFRGRGSSVTKTIHLLVFWKHKNEKTFNHLSWNKNNKKIIPEQKFHAQQIPTTTCSICWQVSRLQLPLHSPIKSNTGLETKLTSLLSSFSYRLSSSSGEFKNCHRDDRFETQRPHQAQLKHFCN